MKLHPFAYRLTAPSFLILGILINSANAGTELCKKPFPSCTSTCGRAATPSSSGVPCEVKVSETSGSTPVATVDRDPICVDPGTDIFWFTSEENSNFTVTFTNHPFVHLAGSVTFIGNEQLTPSGDTVDPDSAGPACYEYSVTHSINHSHASLDPKVIVNGVGLLRPTAPPRGAVKK